MQRLLALGALVLAGSAPAHALSPARPLRPITSAPRILLLQDHDDPSERSRLAGLVALLQPRAISSEELPASLAGYDGFGPLFAWGWSPASLTEAQAGALRDWLAFGGLLLLPSGAFDRSGPTAWLEELMPELEDAERSAGACRRHGLGAVCRVGFDDGGEAWRWDGWLLDKAFAQARPPRGDGSNVHHSALELALRSRHKRKNPAAPLFLFASVYAVCVAWLSWRWFRNRGMEERAWIGVLSLTCLFSAGAVGAGRLLAGGTRELQIAVLHGAPEATRLRLTGWLARFSPNRERWESELPDGVSKFHDLGSGERTALLGTRVEGRSEPGQNSAFAFAGERRLAGPMSLQVVNAGDAAHVRWVNETGLDFERLWVVGAAPDSGRASPAGSTGTLDLAASQRRGFLPPSDWTAEEAAVVDAYLRTEGARCRDCVFLASTRAEPGPAGRKLLYLWSVPQRRVPQ